MKSLQDALNLMDSPVRDTLNFMKDESHFPYEDVFPPDIKSNLFDTHNNASTTCARDKTYLDGPIARLIIDLDERGLPETTIVVVASEFGRKVIDGDIVRNMAQYGPLAHFYNTSMLCFGGGFKRGHVHGTTADASLRTNNTDRHYRSSALRRMTAEQFSWTVRAKYWASRMKPSTALIVRR